ncbi:MAG: response regulator [Candidatus Gribaldobacteria bacterium]|nr:response regulator [Candidatus Gribaldobacteria bacterium]
MAQKILLIEDEPQLVEIYNVVLSKAGFVVETFKYGVEAKEYLATVRRGAEKPSLILIDLILPDMNGIEILEEVKKYPETQDIPCFVSTNYSDPEMEKKCLALKAEKFLLKTDHTPKELAEIVKQRLSG